MSQSVEVWKDNARSQTGYRNDYPLSYSVSTINSGIASKVPKYATISSATLTYSYKSSTASKGDLYIAYDNTSGNTEAYDDGDRIKAHTSWIGTSNASSSLSASNLGLNSGNANAGKITSSKTYLTFVCRATVTRRWTANDKVFTIVYNEPKFSISASAGNTGGTPSADKTSVIITTPSTTGSYTIKANTATGYKLAYWTLNGSRISETSDEFTVNVSQSDLTATTTSRKYVAYFNPNTYIINADFHGYGSGSIDGAGAHYYGTSATLTAIPNDNSEFGGWYDSNGNKVCDTLSYTFTVTGDVTYYAQFNLKKFTLSFNSDGGTAYNSKTITCGNPYGTLPTPTKSGYKFGGWRIAQKVYNSGTFSGNNFVNLGRTYMYPDKYRVKVEAYKDDWSTISTNNQQIMSCTEGGGWGIGYAANTVGHGTEMYVNNKGNGSAGYIGIDFGIANMSSGWHTFEFRFEEGVFTGYVDNVLKGTVDTGIADNTIKYHASNNIIVGAEANASTASANYFVGQIRNVVITHTVTETDIMPAENVTLVAYWILDSESIRIKNIKFTDSASNEITTINPATVGQTLLLTITVE